VVKNVECKPSYGICQQQQQQQQQQQHQTIILVILPALYIFLKMSVKIQSVFEPKKRHLRKVSLYFFGVKKSAVESRSMKLVEASMVKLLRVKQRAVTGFDASKVVILMWKIKKGCCKAKIGRRCRIGGITRCDQSFPCVEKQSATV